MEDNVGAGIGDDYENERRGRRGLAQGHGVSPWMFLQPQRWSALENWSAALVNAGHKEVARDLVLTFMARFRQQAGLLGVDTAVN